MPEKRLQNRQAGADQARIDLGDTPDENICGYPSAVVGRVVAYSPAEADDGDGPITKKKAKVSQSGAGSWGNGSGRTQSRP